MWPATVTGLAAASPAPTLRRRDATSGAFATAIEVRRCAQSHEEQGRPGIEPGRSLAVAAGEVASPLHITGCCAQCRQSRAKRAWWQHRCASLRALRVCATPVMSCAPPRLRAHRLGYKPMPADHQGSCGHGFAVTAGIEVRRFAQRLEVEPPPTPGQSAAAGSRRVPRRSLPERLPGLPSAPASGGSPEVALRRRGSAKRYGQFRITFSDATTQELHKAKRLAVRRHMQAVDFLGGQGRNRTTDTRIFSPLLYQLSYLAAVSRAF